MKRIQIMITVLALMLTLTACGKSEFGVTENSRKHMTVTAENADKDAFVMVGSLEVANGEEIAIAANLAKGSVRVEIVRSPDNQSINEIPEMNGEASITANLENTDGASGTVPAGTYMLRATCLKKATGTVQIDVVPPVRQDGDRFDDVIMLEGMEETVHYEHVRNDVLGFEMDYDYENFVRHSESDREWFVSQWDNPGNPENYLEVSCSRLDAETAAANICEALSGEYEVRREDAFALERAGNCIRIYADAVKGGGYMPEHLQAVYVIPSSDGCRIATAHCYITESEGFLRRFGYMMNTFSAVAAQPHA